MAEYWVAPPGASGVLNDIDSGGRDENTPWDLDFVRKASNMGTLFQAGDNIYLVGNKGHYLKGDLEENFKFDINCPTGGVDFATEYAANNFAGIKSGSINFMTAPGHPEAVIRRDGHRPSGNSYLLSTSTAGYNVNTGIGLVFWNVRVTSDNWTRSRVDGANNGPVTSGVALYGDNCGLINCTLDNNAINIGPQKTGNGVFLYGVLSSQAGWAEADRKHGHNYYVQNSEANSRRQSYINCIGQFSCGMNFQMYGESRDFVNGVETHLIANLDIIGCHTIDAGAITGTHPSTAKPKGDWNYLLGGYQKKVGNKLLNNSSYNSTLNGSTDSQGNISASGIRFGYVNQFNDQYVTENDINDNYFHNRAPISFVNLWRDNNFLRNTFVIETTSRLAAISYRNGANIADNNDFDENTWYAINPNAASNAFVTTSFVYDANTQQHILTNTDHSVSSFKTTFSPLEAASTFTAGIPSGDEIFYRKNDFIGLDSVTTKGQYMGHIVIYNWGSFDTVDVDLSELGFSSGDDYTIYDSQNYAGQAIQNGTYAGSDVAINMVQTAVTPTKGDLTQPVHTDKRHIVVQIYKTSDLSGGTNNPPAIDNIPDRGSITKDSGQQVVNLTGINDPDGDTIVITASTDRPDLITNLTVNYTSPSTTGTLTYEPVAGAVGSGSITVTVSDPVVSTIQVFTFNIQDNAVPDAAPSLLVGSGVGSTSFTATWQDNSSNETNFELEVYTTSGGTNPISGSPFVIDPNIETYQISDLTPETQYYFRVRATNPVGVSSYSNEADITTGAANQIDIDSISLVNLSQFDEYADSIPLLDGNTYNLNEHIPNAFTVEALTNPQVIEGGSVVIEHVESGFTITENGYPYNMGFYDAVNGGNFSGFVLGTNTIRATPYDGPSGTGVAGTTYEISFTVTNVPAFLIPIEDLTINKNTNIIDLEFVTVKAPVDEGLTVTVASSNATLFPTDNITLGGNERNRTISLVPVFNKIGKSTITLTLSDGVTQVTNEFDVTVIENNPIGGEVYANSVGPRVLIA